MYIMAIKLPEDYDFFSEDLGVKKSRPFSSRFTPLPSSLTAGHVLNEEVNFLSCPISSNPCKQVTQFLYVA